MDSTQVAEKKVSKNQIVIAKDNQGDQGYKEYSKSYSLINKYLETKFGTARFLLPIVVMTKTTATPNTETPKTNLLAIIPNWRQQNIIVTSMTGWICF